MKKCFYSKVHYCILLIVSSLSISIANSQAVYNSTSWRFSNPTPMGITIVDLDFYDNNSAIAVGTDGGIARTTDGGTNWTYGVLTFTTSSGAITKPSISDVHFVTSTVAYAVGTNGCMVKSTDGGATWSFVNNPLFNNARSINTVWFIDANKGYIGGQWNTADSIPKIYVTNNGGATWDSLATPAVNGTTKVGFINNATYPAIDYPVTAKAKEIYRITFLNNSIGYISGGGSSLFPSLDIPNITNTTTCAFSGIQTTGSQNASLLWKFDNGTLTDYSISKERLGYTGYPATLNCSSKFGSVNQCAQQYRALNIINDSTIVMMSYNNNVVIKIKTGKNDSTQNINRPGVYEKGKYEVLNTGPSGPPPGYPAIPAVQVLSASNPYQLLKTSDGKLYANGNFARLWVSADTGRNWVQQNCYPAGTNFSNFAAWALDITPGGKFFVMGQNGAMADSSSGGVWKSNYKLQVTGSYENIDFADCNNGMATGGPTIAVTNDGGKTWFDRSRQDFANLFININGHTYVPGNAAKAYFATSVGIVYKSNDMNVVPPATPTMDPVYSDNSSQFWDVATVGNDSVWVCGYNTTAVPVASRKPVILRSINGGANWTVYNNFFPGTNYQNFRFIEFPTNLVGYVSGTRDTIWKTTDGGVTWNKLPLPTPGVTPQITYTDMFAVDANTVFLTGNGFPRRVVFKTTDGGNTWQDITNNIATTYSNFGNINAVVFHDANNGYVSVGGGILKTTDGGATWTADLAPSSMLGGALAFAPKKVTVPVSFQNRKLFLSGATLPNVFGHILEYGNPANINVNSTETIVNASCTNPSGGTITINATGGIAPYTYSINGGAFQASNSFTGLTQGARTITIKDSYCGTLTKSVNVGFNGVMNALANAGPDLTIVEGDQVQLQGSGVNAVSAAWTPANTLTNPGSFTPMAKPSGTTTYTLTVKNIDNCTATDNVIVTVVPYCIKVMNAFTPNGDGTNDRWIVTTGNCTNQVKVRVFNRYGQEVYKNDNYQNNWDGTFGGKAIPDATYYYVIDFRLITGRAFVLKGDVTILR